MIMKNPKRTMLIVLSLLVTLAFIALFSIHRDMSVIVDGEPVTGLTGAGYAFGGTVIGLVAAFLALILVSLILTGVSILVMIVLTAVFFVVLALLSPLVLPFLFMAGLVWFFGKRKKVSAA
jgi:hypothetical protein